MAQINLLKQKTDNTALWANVTKIFARVLVVVLVVLAGYYIWLHFQEKQADGKIVDLEQQISKAKEASMANKDRYEVLTRQQQLKTLDTLITTHLYWSDLLPALAKVTLKKAAYTSLKASADGSLTLSVTLPTLQDLDKFLQVFDLPQFNSNFSNVRIGAFHEVPQGDSTVVKVDVRMTFNPQLLKYQSIVPSSLQK